MSRLTPNTRTALGVYLELMRTPPWKVNRLLRNYFNGYRGYSDISLLVWYADKEIWLKWWIKQIYEDKPERVVRLMNQHFCAATDEVFIPIVHITGYICSLRDEGLYRD